jgi:hypothetical protein
VKLGDQGAVERLRGSLVRRRLDVPVRLVRRHDRAVVAVEAHKVAVRADLGHPALGREDILQRVLELLRIDDDRLLVLVDVLVLDILRLHDLDVVRTPLVLVHVVLDDVEFVREFASMYRQIPSFFLIVLSML